MINKKLAFLILIIVQSISATNLPTIHKLYLKGNKHIKDELILSRIPYKKGQQFDEKLSTVAIDNLYAIGYFNQIKIEVEDLADNKVNLFITMHEKKLLEKTIFKGNSAIKTKDLIKKFVLDKKETIDEEDLAVLTDAIKQKYKEEGFLFIKINTKLITNKETPDKVSAQFNIQEGIKSRVIQIQVKGNKRFTENKIKKLLLTKEFWLFGPVFGDGRYIPEMVNVDKNRIEHFYKDNGYLMAKVINTEVKFSNNNQNIILIFHISEGDLFRIRNIEAPGDDIFLEKDLIPHIPLETGKPYPHSKVLKAIEKLKDLWGEKGYVNADVYPQLNPDEEACEVDITFYADRGNKVHVNRIDISGNEYTKDKVIRRNIDLEEGGIITSQKLEEAKEAIEHLSYFKRGQVNWRLHRITDEEADLELNVQEALTGQFNTQLSYGSSQHSNKNALKAGIVLEKRNFMGEGIDVGFNSQVQLAKHGSRWFETFVENPHIFDSNISGRLNAFNRNQEFDEWFNVTATPGIQEYGGALSLGFILPKLDRFTAFDFEIGLQDVHAKKQDGHKIFANMRGGGSAQENAVLQKILDNSFKDSTLQWFALKVFKDTRNHLIYPSAGFKFELLNKIALPGINKNYSFIKSELELSYYTALIGEDTLVLMLHGKLGSVYEIGDNLIPYKELYHMGGQKSVRGFKFGEIGPAWRNRDPLGARNAFQFNTELIFPILADYSMKAHLFYDAGSGWNTAPRKTSSTERSNYVTRNKFNFRQSVGFGLNLVNPQPIQIDWGYKLDRNRDAGESPHELHLSANFAF